MSVYIFMASHNFDLIHCDLWTSPVLSVSGYKYYLVDLDDCSHYLWTLPLRLKSDMFSILTNFFAYVKTQFRAGIKVVQCDNGHEFDNSSARTFFLTHNVHLRMSCPYTLMRTSITIQEHLHQQHQKHSRRHLHHQVHLHSRLRHHPLHLGQLLGPVRGN